MSLAVSTTAQHVVPCIFSLGWLRKKCLNNPMGFIIIELHMVCRRTVITQTHSMIKFLNTPLQISMSFFTTMIRTCTNTLYTIMIMHNTLSRVRLSPQIHARNSWAQGFNNHSGWSCTLHLLTYSTAGVVLRGVREKNIAAIITLISFYGFILLLKIAFTFHTYIMSPQCLVLPSKGR